LAATPALYTVLIDLSELVASYFAQQLLRWHSGHPRPLPWDDGPRDPYHIWISEVIMQQTRIEQGAAYYHRFIGCFPDVSSLANAPADEVLRYWQGLGYYTRARNLHAAAKLIVHQYGGIFPSAYNDIIRLPGIGPYSAAAIASFAFGASYPVVDGNVKRVIARFTGIQNAIDLPQVHDEVKSVAEKLMAGTSAAVFNQAIMNFGALVCKPKGALCVTCPLSKKCYAFQNGMVDTLPVRVKKKKNTIRYLHFLVITYRGKILLERREGKDIWRGLYTPPMLEMPTTRSPLKSVMRAYLQPILGHRDMEWISSSGTTQQMLSHQTLFGRFHFFKTNTSPKLKNDSRIWVSSKNIHAYGKPKMVADLLK
jgi:A/G-specific adenine glycosylase